MRRFLLLFSLAITQICIFAQLSFKPNNPSIIVKPSDSGQLLEILITNTGSSSLPAYWKLIKDNNFKQSWETYMCDLEFCYGINIDQSNPSLPNSLKTGTHKFELHFTPKNVQGNTNVILKLYSDKNYSQEILSIPINLNSSYLKHQPDELVINTTPNSGDNKLNITYVNSHDTTYTVYWKVIKDPATWKPQWETYICDLEFCYGNNIDQSNPSLPNKFKKGNNLVEFHFFPNGVSGNTKVGFKLFADKNFTQEIYSSVVQINNGLSSTKDDANLVSITVQPNPANEFISLPVDIKIDRIDIINATGQIIKVANVGTEGESVFVGDLSPATYFIKAYDQKSKNIGFSKFLKL